MSLPRLCECVVRRRPQVRTVLSYWVQIESPSDILCTISPLTAGSHEVMVQGKQTSAVLELLSSLGKMDRSFKDTAVGRKK